MNDRRCYVVDDRTRILGVFFPQGGAGVCIEPEKPVHIAINGRKL